MADVPTRSLRKLVAPGAAPVQWRVFARQADYLATLSAMEARAEAIAACQARECVWLVEHPPVYTAGTSAKAQDLIAPKRFPVHRVGRGGQYTYHGPGQRVAYVMLDLKSRGGDVRVFVNGLEEWLIATLARFDVRAGRRTGRVGVWVRRPEKGAGAEDKIAALGIRLRRWVSFHGVSLNIAPDLEHYSGIVPCGVHVHGVTSLADLGVAAGMNEVDAVLRAEFERLFGATEAMMSEEPETEMAADRLQTAAPAQR